MRPEPVLEIPVLAVAIGTTVLAVDTAGQQQPMNRLQPPTAIEQSLGQPIEKFRVAGILALGPEVVGRSNQATTEVMVPEAIDNDPGQQVPGSAFGIGHPASQ